MAIAHEASGGRRPRFLCSIQQISSHLPRSLPRALAPSLALCLSPYKSRCAAAAAGDAKFHVENSAVVEITKEDRREGEEKEEE